MEGWHRKNSPGCKEECERRGLIPVRVEHDSPEEALKWGGDASNTELHVIEYHGFVDDILSINGEHVFCTGHDYNERGMIGKADAEFIAHAPEDIDFLLAQIDGLDRALKIRRGY